MTVGVRNWPRKPLSDKERTIRETLDRIEADRHCVFVPAGGGIQTAVNDLTAAGGGLICLERGDYSGDITISDDIQIYGAGMEATRLTGNVTITGAKNRLENLWVYADGKSYGVKLYVLGGGPARNEFRFCRIGGTADGTGKTASGDGPDVGMWIDGAILTVADHCSFAFCKNGSGLYVNTSQTNLGSNVNTFRDCTFNGNTSYGVEIITGGDGIAGLLLHNFHGGNMEDNDSGEVFTTGAIGIELRNMDFETSKSIAATLNISATSVIVENCHGVTTGSGAYTRFFDITSNHVVVRGCRVSGNFVNSDIGVFQDTGYFAQAYDNHWWDPNGAVVATPRWINNRCGMQGYF